MKEQQSNWNTTKVRFVKLLASVGCLAVLAQGCAVGPNYKRPAIDSPTNFRNASAAASTNSLADLHIIVLSDFIEEARAEGMELREQER